MAILYAEKDIFSSLKPADGIIQEDLDNVYVFKADQDKLLKAADNLLATSSSSPAAADAEPVCFSCGKTARAAGCDQNLRACSKCQKAKYCSRECQLADWNEGGHKGLCKQMSVLHNLVKLLSAPYEDDVDFVMLGN